MAPRDGHGGGFASVWPLLFVFFSFRVEPRSWASYGVLTNLLGRKEEERFYMCDLYKAQIVTLDV